MYKVAESWIRPAFHLKEKTGVMWYKNWYRLPNSCSIASQTFIISYLMFQSSNFKTLIKKNKKSSKFKNFRWFRRFALYHESAESAESWEDFVILADKRLDYFLTELKWISNLQNHQKTGSGQLFTWKITTGVMWYRNW